MVLGPSSFPLWPHHPGAWNPSQPPGWGSSEKGTLASEPTAGKHTYHFSHVLLAVMGRKTLPRYMGARRRDCLLWKMGLNHWRAMATSVTVNWFVLLVETNFLFSMAIFILASKFLLHLALIMWHTYAKQNNIHCGSKQAVLGGMQACPLLCVPLCFNVYMQKCKPDDLEEEAELQPFLPNCNKN